LVGIVASAPERGVLKIRGCAPCGPLLSGVVISRVLRKLSFHRKTQQFKLHFNI
jgi:hypothetical protein